jgi:hypothetical protein
MARKVPPGFGAASQCARELPEKPAVETLGLLGTPQADGGRVGKQTMHFGVRL